MKLCVIQIKVESSPQKKEDTLGKEWGQISTLYMRLQGIADEKIALR